jgi:hypothetical protein
MYNIIICEERNMDKKNIIAASLIISALTGCIAVNLLYSQYRQNREWLINEAENSFKYELFLMTNELGQIYMNLVDVGSAENRNYVLGKIDSYLSNNPYHEIQRILAPDNISEELSNDILDPALRMPIKDLMFNSRKHLEKLRREIIDINDIDNLQNMSVKFYEISNLFKELDFGNADSLADQNIVDDCLRKLDKLNSILSQE